MNNITIAGVIGKDLEVIASAKGDFGKISVADKQKDNTIWWNILVGSKQAAALQPYLLKGAFVVVTGTVSEKEYTSKDGTLKRSYTVYANNIQLGNRRKEGESKKESVDDEPF